jgi:hypothetical protein
VTTRLPKEAKEQLEKQKKLAAKSKESEERVRAGRRGGTRRSGQGECAEAD